MNDFVHVGHAVMCAGGIRHLLFFYLFSVHPSRFLLSWIWPQSSTGKMVVVRAILPISLSVDWVVSAGDWTPVFPQWLQLAQVFSCSLFS